MKKIEVPVVPMPAHLVLGMARCVRHGYQMPDIADAAVVMIATALTDEETKMAMKQASRYFLEDLK